MRIRRKPWARPELDASPFFVKEPQQWRGRWRECFADPSLPLRLELGCGKGGFISKAAVSSPAANFLAADKISNMLGLCKRAVEQEYAAAGLQADNIRLAAFDAERIGALFSQQDAVDRLYIFFPNPWPKERHKKHRLTYPRQLAMYRQFLAPDARIYIKSDDAPFFEDTCRYLEQAGFCIEFHTNNLHGSGLAGNIETEHEEMFARQGLPIHFLIARRSEADALDGVPQAF